MSASLVGSEMCIRDSPELRLRSRVWLLLGAAVDGDPQGLLQVGRVRAPVSYTHLTLPTICSV
eukprot:4689345-Alexandrium_andersonii.AAC.1